MAKKKEELIAILVKAEIVTESNQETFEKTLTNPELESIVAIVSKNKDLELELGQSESEKEALQTQLDLAKESLNTSEAEKKELENALNSLVETKVDSEKVVPGLQFEFRKEKYAFLDTAPKTITYGGVARTQKELSKLDEADVIGLIGDLSLIKKIRK